MRVFIAIVALSIPLVLSGCIAALIGATATTGGVLVNEVNKSKKKKERAYERRIKGEIERGVEVRIKQEREYNDAILKARLPSKDWMLEQRLANEFLGGQLTHVLSINPQVRGGVVTLYGTVPSPIIADRAVESARRIPGVKTVVSQLMINERVIKPLLDEKGSPVNPPYPHRQQQFAPIGIQQFGRVGVPQGNIPYGLAPPVPMGVPSNMVPPQGRAMGYDPRMMQQRQAPPAYYAPQRPLVPQQRPAQNMKIITPKSRMIAPPPRGSIIQNPQGQNLQILNVQKSLAPPNYAPQQPVMPNYYPPQQMQRISPQRMPPQRMPPLQQMQQPQRMQQPMLGQAVPRHAVPQAVPRIQKSAVKTVKDAAKEAAGMLQVERPAIKRGREHWFPKYITPESVQK